jgi:hypothetical protein
MAQADYARNLFGPQRQGDLSLVLIKIGAGSGQAALIAADSSPGITVATPGSGVYTVTFPGGVNVFSVAQECINSGTDKMSLTALAQTAGVVTLTATKSDTTDCAGSEQIHLAFFVGAP